MFDAAAVVTTGMNLGYSAFQTNRTNQKNRDMAGEQMAFQERMSSTAHQRAVEDMKKAGLNPILAAGSPASSPGGAMASAQTPNTDVGSVLTSSLEAKRFKQEVEMQKEQIAKTKQEVQTNKAAEQNQIAQALAARQTAINAATANRIQNVEADIAETGKDARQKMAPYQPYIDAVGKALGVVGSAAGAAVGARGALRGSQMPGIKYQKPYREVPNSTPAPKPSKKFGEEPHWDKFWSR